MRYYFVTLECPFGDAKETYAERTLLAASLRRAQLLPQCEGAPDTRVIVMRSQLCDPPYDDLIKLLRR